MTRQVLNSSTSFPRLHHSASSSESYAPKGSMVFAASRSGTQLAFGRAMRRYGSLSSDGRLGERLVEQLRDNNVRAKPVSRTTQCNRGLNFLSQDGA